MNQQFISEEEAIRLAQKACSERGWLWIEPIKIISSRDEWIIHTNWKYRGPHSRIIINKITGRVKRGGPLWGYQE